MTLPRLRVFVQGGADSLRPFFSYFGGKWTLARRYAAPEHDVIVEPFAGSAGYATRYPERDVILVERAPHIAALWRWLIGVSSDEIESLPLDPTSLDGLPAEAQILVRFWCARGRTRTPGTVSSWMSSGAWPSSFWGAYARGRIARQVNRIRHWRVIESDYSAAPDVEATWFIDPPYIGDRHYEARVGDYEALGAWCRARRGTAIVCEREGATWLPFSPLCDARSIARRPYREVVYVQRSDARTQLQQELAL